ncbi:MAG: histidine phosphatase family protein, partial [Candidatus Limnocylindrales bacterium]
RSHPEQHLGQHLDIELSEAGRSAAKALGRRLTGVRFDRVVSSPLKRAHETARLVVADQEAESEPRLVEMDYGEWEGLTYAEIDAQDGERRRAWEADPAHAPCPGGESGGDVAKRVRAWLDELGHWHAGRLRTGDELRILAVGHSTTNRILLCVALDVPLRAYRDRFRQEPANLTVLQYPAPGANGARLVLANDVSHIRGTSGDTWS